MSSPEACACDDSQRLRAELASVKRAEPERRITDEEIAMQLLQALGLSTWNDETQTDDCDSAQVAEVATALDAARVALRSEIEVARMRLDDGIRVMNARLIGFRGSADFDKMKGAFIAGYRACAAEQAKPEPLCLGCGKLFTSPDFDPRCSSCAESGTGPEPTKPEPLQPSDGDAELFTTIREGLRSASRRAFTPANAALSELERRLAVRRG